MVISLPSDLETHVDAFASESKKQVLLIASASTQAPDSELSSLNLACLLAATL